MNLKCLIGMHAWNGCQCARCGSTRDEAHAWNGCKCSLCGATRDEAHDRTYNCGQCAKCGKTTTRNHEWNAGCKCKKCGATRDHGHKWVRDSIHPQDKKCIVCGKVAQKGEKTGPKKQKDGRVTVVTHGLECPHCGGGSLSPSPLGWRCGVCGFELRR